MGQKVHPLGFRVGITKPHQSQWFARFQKYGYAQSVVEDHMLRKTLQNLFSNLETESAQSSKPGAKGKVRAPQITQIKIERGLIPYEIGIQIHADDCLELTKAIDNLKINKDLVSNLQKTRKYLFKASNQVKNSIATEAMTVETAAVSDSETLTKTGSKKKRTYLTPARLTRKQKTNKKFKFKNLKRFGSAFKKRTTGFSKKKRLSKPLFMRLKALKKRFKKRQNLRKGYRKLIAKGLFIRKQGTVITRKVVLKNKKRALARKQAQQKLKNKKFLPAAKVSPKKTVVTTSATTATKTKKAVSTKVRVKNNSFINRMYKKFAGLFLNKVNKQFLLRLKSIMKYWTREFSKKAEFAPLGYNPKWSSPYTAILTETNANLTTNKTLARYQIEKLNKLVAILEKKSLIKMEALRKDYMTFGSLSATRAFGYYQIITFLKQLKELVNKLKKPSLLKAKTANQGSSNLNSNTKTNKENALATVTNTQNALLKEKIRATIRAKSKQKQNLTQKLLTSFKKVAEDNQVMTNECRKIKLLSYLKDVVIKHRTENIFYYLATIAEARRDLKNLKLYVKQHANFLLGLNLDSLTSLQGANVRELAIQKITKALSANSNEQFTDGSAGLQKAFLNFVNDQRKLYKANLALTPKISIKFYSVKTTDMLEKATVVADSIVDALEKRKAFRGVIKKAKEDLMKRSRVKGVKIQVSGRLNGAEIARSEWVRAGRVPLQTLRANIDYSYRTASTIYGIIGVKVWIFKGYSKLS